MAPFPSPPSATIVSITQTGDGTWDVLFDRAVTANTTATDITIQILSINSAWNVVFDVSQSDPYTVQIATNNTGVWQSGNPWATVTSSHPMLLDYDVPLGQFGYIQ